MNRFKRARLLAGVTQTEVAKQLGVSTAAVCQWETGKRMPRVKRLQTVADILHTTVADLLEEERAV
jgi:transcriptional regulator with XRE-family HTH domain